jgi:MFS family permease
MRQPYGWVIVAAGALMTCVAIGSMFSLAVFLQPVATDTGWSRSGIATAATLDFVCMGAAAFMWGALSDRWGARRVVLIGSLLLGTGLVLASQAASLLQFQLLLGVVVGIAAGGYYAPMVSVATAWLEHRRNLAVALVSAGMGIGSLTVSPFVGWMLTTYDWRTTMLTLGIAGFALLLPAAWLVRPPPARTTAAAASPGAADQRYPLTATQAMRTPQFAAIALTHLACCVAHSGPLFHMVTYATLCGIAPLAAVSIFSVAGLGGLAGRLLFGVLADRHGVKPVLVTGLTVQALAAGSYLAVGSLGEFYALSIVFGIAYAGVMPLYAVLVRETFGPHTMGTTFGAVSMVASFGMAIGPLAGGIVYDAFDNYAWLYISSLITGLGAAAIALTFRPALAPPASELKPA